ncbi:MAG: glycosyltransferase family 4 protein [Verrucomicrobiota bacterium]|nr:glycosyltransferase family 4 protein [Verrucomicrobiota bacterium]
MNGSLRIAQVAPLWAAVPPAGYGGIELVVSLLTEELVRRGHDVTLFASGDSHTAARLESVCAENILELMSRGSIFSYDFYAAANLARALAAADQFDLIHVHLGNQWIPFGAMTKVPTIFTMHTQPSEDDAWIVREHPAVPVAAISAFQAESLKSGRDIPVVYNGCDFDSFTPSFSAGGYAAFFGRMSREKNPLDAIRIAQRAGLPIVLAGMPQNSNECSYFDREIKPLIDNSSVRHIGAVNHAQKNEFLRNASVLISPLQWSEPFGLVMIEAMACGTPVLARRCGAIGEIVDTGKTGFSAEEISGFDALLERTMALDRRTVREHARARFGHTRMADDYLALYRAIARGAADC